MLEANQIYASTFSLADLPPLASAGFELVTCMDTRIDPLAVLGLRPGEAKIVRNAGGRVTKDVLRSLALATHFLGVREVAVMHHTGCALAGTTDQEVRSRLPEQQRSGIAGWELLAMPEPEAALATDVAAVRSFSALPVDVKVEGWRYDVATGLVHRIIPSAGPSCGDTLLA